MSAGRLTNIAWPTFVVDGASRGVGWMTEQIAIVTGAGGNIGVGVVRALAKAGATVVGLDVKIARIDAAARAIELDVTDPAACAAVVDEIVAEFGGVDTLVNLAQVMRHGF